MASNERWSVPPVFETESVAAPISRRGMSHWRNNARTDSLPCREKRDYALLLKTTTRASLFFRSLARACSSHPKADCTYIYIPLWHNDEMCPSFSYFSQAETLPYSLDKPPQPVYPNKLDRN